MKEENLFLFTQTLHNFLSLSLRNMKEENLFLSVLGTRMEKIHCKEKPPGQEARAVGGFRKQRGGQKPAHTFMYPANFILPNTYEYGSQLER